MKTELRKGVHKKGSSNSWRKMRTLLAMMSYSVMVLERRDADEAEK